MCQRLRYALPTTRSELANGEDDVLSRVRVRFRGYGKGYS